MELRGIFDRLRDLRGRVTERVRTVNDRTEKAVLAAGRHLNGVGEIARTHIAQLRELLTGPLGTTDSPLHQAIRSQATHVREHAQMLGSAVTAHADEVVSVATAARAITTAAAQIERANTAARVLSLNIRIESARAGAEVFSTIADEMHGLSRAIVDANARIQQLAKSMEHTLPRLVEQSVGLREMVSTYAVEAGARVEKIDREVVALRGTISTSVESSDRALAAIISESAAGISELQFQDVCAQSLLQLDGWQAGTMQELASELEVEVEIEPGIRAISTEDQILDWKASGDLVVF